MLRRSHVALYVAAVAWFAGAFMGGYFSGITINDVLHEGLLGGLVTVGLATFTALGSLMLVGLIVTAVDWVVDGD